MRWLIRLLVLVVVLAALLAGAFFLIPTQRIARLAEAQFEAATGRAMHLGDVHATLWPRPGVTAGRVEIANAAWSSAGPMLVARGLRVGIDPRALLGGTLRLRKVVLEEPKLLLETGPKGQVNWDFGGPAAPAVAPAPEEAARQAKVKTEARATVAAEAGTKAGTGSDTGDIGAATLSLDDAVIENGSVTVLDDARKTRRELTGIDAELKLPAAAGPGDLMLEAHVGGQKVQLTGHVERVDAFVAGKPVSAALRVEAGDARIDFTGTAGTAPWQLKGGVDARLGNLSAVFAALGQRVPALPQGLGAKRIAVKGQLGYDGKGLISLRDAEIHLDNNMLTGGVSLALGGSRPKLAGQLSGRDLSVDTGAAAADRSTAKGARGGAAAGWSKTPIDLGALTALDADLKLFAGGLHLGGLTLGQSTIGLALQGGTARVSLLPVTAYRGQVTGTVTLHAAAGPPDLAADLSVQDLALQPLLTDLDLTKRLIGSAAGTLSVGGQGASVDAIMHSLSGSGSLSVGKGELRGLDLAGMLTHLDLGYQGAGKKTIFDGIRGSFTLKGGVLTNDDLALTAPLLTATGKGTVNLGDRTLDYTVAPTALKGVAGDKGLTVPVKIAGRWSNPSYRLDTSAGVAKTAKDAAEKAIGKSLGIGDQPGGSLEDKAKQGLMKLLGK